MEGGGYIAFLSLLIPLGRHVKKLIQKWIAIATVDSKFSNLFRLNDNSRE